MKLRYTYHSEHHADNKDRWFHFVLFAGAFLLLLAAGQQFFLFFTDWHASDEEHSWWHLGLGVIYLLGGLLMAYAGYRADHASRGDLDRYVRVSDKHLVWKLDQKEGEQELLLEDITGIERPNVRDLVLKVKGGSQIFLPIYLITHDGKQEELMAILQAQTKG
ncbi:hypothetical protein [Neolewinella agarilytica]|uniref:Uncharacterized protein n=1 Tax=Neolewinella agarilytica TaxID=478744 RepID=A0A1H9IM29_9BACT|nr:hypothetical protein [Neolewinella agarilytica]SEQ75618.1 hypothetical protein SAMN05444359_11556 [Neolewinella agarilytica]